MPSRLLLRVVTVPALALAITIAIVWQLQPVPALLRAIPAALLMLCVARPASGLMALAGLGPVAGPIAELAGESALHPPFLEQLMLASIAGIGLRLWRDRQPSRAAPWATLLATLAAASAMATLPELLLRAEPGTTMREHLVAFAGGAYFTRGPLWQPLHAAALMIEGLAVAVAGERVLRRHPGATTHVLWMFLAGVAAVALLNVAQLIEVAAREGDLLSSMPALGLQLRVSRFYDVNAAGTVFVMTGLAAFGLGRESWRWLLVAASPLLLLGLWLSGSRTAIGTLVLMLSAALVHAMLVTHGRRRWVAGLTLGLLAASAIVVAALYPADRNASAVPAFATRRILAATSVEMWRSAPVFGIGVGRFHAESSRFGGMALREELNFGTANENAHNNFLQVLGELGLAGLLVLVILLGDTLAAALRSERQSSSTVRYWLIAGVGAGLMTWLTGHPLLVPDAAFAFWMLFGVLSAMTAPPAGRVLPVAATILTLAIAAAAPVRTYTARASADLEHVGIGVSVWQPDPSVDRYREAGADFALYLPADGSTLTLPMRRAPAAPNPVRVAFAAHGQLLNEVVIDSSAWHPIPISLPSRGRRFELVQFRVTADQPLSDNRSILHVGIVR